MSLESKFLHWPKSWNWFAELSLFWKVSELIETRCISTPINYNLEYEYYLVDPVRNFMQSSIANDHSPVRVGLFSV